MALRSRPVVLLGWLLVLTACSEGPSSAGAAANAPNGPGVDLGGQHGTGGSNGGGDGGPESNGVPWPAQPVIPDKACSIDLAAHAISSDGTNPDATTDGITAAVKALAADGCGHIKLPAGTYAIGKKASDAYTAGIKLVSNISFEMDPGATLRLIPTDTWAYCVIEISRQHDVRVSGGAIIGDRANHTYKSGAGDEGHDICVQDESERVAIDHMKLSGAIGDGVLIVAQGAPGSSCKDVSITNSELFDNRRQGVSIVGGIRVLIQKNEIHHINGTAPQFGVDIESLNYKSEDVVIRDNKFHHNKGGDVVNTDGRKVVVERNTMEDGDGNTYVDGPLIFWNNTDGFIRANTIYMARGSANGKMGILEYSSKRERTNPERIVIEENTLTECNIDVMYDSKITMRRNTVKGPGNAFILYHVRDVELVDNVLEKDGTSYSYMIHDATGTASGNILNGKPFPIGMTPDAPWSNWDGN